MYFSDEKTEAETMSTSHKGPYPVRDGAGVQIQTACLS
jgi:hypothetical protein